MTKTDPLNVINWFELEAQSIAKWTPRHAIEGYAMGAYALGSMDEALWYRALEIQDAWQRALRSTPASAKEL
ncbi:hypothetical protein ACU635_50455 [[Actinomadura] parvosata]|uniref:hypothetical protein n=1 Tax=[Actinomadura] parvosata TaxID=1955412 RepID=UPI00406D43C6